MVVVGYIGCKHRQTPCCTGRDNLISKNVNALTYINKRFYDGLLRENDELTS
jgi:hypothetical protein